LASDLVNGEDADDPGDVAGHIHVRLEGDDQCPQEDGAVQRGKLRLVAKKFGKFFFHYIGVSVTMITMYISEI
jgi:hypothetical protein